MVKLGCEVLADDPPLWLRTKRLGLLSNQASVNRSFDHVLSIIQRLGGRIRYLFSPQHGFYAEKQANMKESSDDWNAVHQIPVISLYSHTRQPAAELLDNIDILLVDLQDVGTRVYTYTTTIGLCMEAAAEVGIKVVILDRPNPVNGIQVEGNMLNGRYRSFVGRYAVPMRHGLTIGEFARYIVQCCNVDCELEVVSMEGWERSRFFSATLLPWVFPSPNMPTWETSLFYPGMVLLEGTNVSEGRGTTMPFQLFGAPFIDQRELLNFLAQYDLEGVVLRPITFEPAFDKWRGKTCQGFHIHVTDALSFRPYRFGLALLQAMLNVHGEQFQWLPPPYEYEYEKLPIDIILGDAAIREEIEQGVDICRLEAGWRGDLDHYQGSRQSCLLYGE